MGQTRTPLALSVNMKKTVSRSIKAAQAAVKGENKGQAKTCRRKRGMCEVWGIGKKVEVATDSGKIEAAVKRYLGIRTESGVT